MFSETQLTFLSQIVSQYDYYVVYYYGTYKEYQPGEARDSLIKVYCSDEQPTFSDGHYLVTNATYYEVSNNKYLMQSDEVTADFVPLGSSDIVYTNAFAGSPRLDYHISTIRTDAPYFVFYGVLAIVAISIVLRIIFGR